MDKLPFKKTRKSLGKLLQQFRVVVSSIAEAISEARKDYESRKKPKNKES